eukprot:GHVR01045490.1.p1 GENE.GHVR01045490.1~~GHVR01045490.1.p1  ORF type:complete len:614 (+),score=138.65 GHVR01045490.1:69-1910(+)
MTVREQMDKVVVVVGQRVATDGDTIGTARYVGVIEGDTTKDTWVGVEWDNSARGKHSGKYNDKEYFVCHVSGSGSFIRSSKINTGIDFFEAVSKKYQFKNDVKESLEFVDSKTQKSKPVEFVGQMKANEFFQSITSLETIELNSYFVSSIGKYVPLPSLPVLLEAHLECNLLSRWECVSSLLDAAPNLHTLSLSKNRFQPLSDKIVIAHSNLKVLTLNACFLPWLEVCTLCRLLPSVTEIHLCSNEMSDNLCVCMSVATNCVCGVCIDTQMLTEALSNIETLDLQNNCIRSWNTVVLLADTLNSLSKLLLGENPLSSVESLSSDPNHRLKSFSIDSTDIDNFHTFGILGKKFPDVLELSCSSISLVSVDDNIKEDRHASKRHTVVHSHVGTHAHLTKSSSHENNLNNKFDKALTQRTLRQLLICLFQHMNKLNNSEVGARERRDAERYTLVMAGREQPSITNKQITPLAQVDPDGRMLKRLLRSHGADYCDGTVLGSPQDFTPTRVSLYFQCKSGVYLQSDCVSQNTQSFKFPLTTTVSQVKAALFRKFKIPIKRQKLRIADGDLGVLLELGDDSKELSHFGLLEGTIVQVDDEDELAAEAEAVRKVRTIRAS